MNSSVCVKKCKKHKTGESDFYIIRKFNISSENVTIYVICGLMFRLSFHSNGELLRRLDSLVFDVL